MTNAKWPAVGLFLIITIFAVTLFLIFGLYARQAGRACTDRRHAYDALRTTIVQQNQPQRPSEVILDALPEFRPFFTPGNPLYDEQLRDSHARRDKVLAKLGDRPVC